MSRYLETYAAAGILRPRTAFATLPLLWHRVQTSRFFARPSTSARTRWRFGFHLRLVLLFA